jgi:hypothetical protein
LQDSSLPEKCHARLLQRPAFIAKRMECGSLLPLFDRPIAFARPKSVGKPTHSKRFAKFGRRVRPSWLWVCLAERQLLKERGDYDYDYEGKGISADFQPQMDNP